MWASSEKGTGLSAAIEARGRGQDELAYTVAATEVQQVEGADDIGVDVDPGVFHALAHPGPGGEVDHRVERPPLLPHGARVTPIGDVDAPEVRVPAFPRASPSDSP